jgi:hypothetical protein
MSRSVPGRIPGIVNIHNSSIEVHPAGAVYFPDFDTKNAAPSNPLSGVSCRPDSVALIYSGPTPFAPERTATPSPGTSRPASWNAPAQNPRKAVPPN